MDLQFDLSLASGYASSAQRARRLTEGWLNQNMFCPRCGNTRIEQFANNRPVADFFCPRCSCQYELKSKNGVLGERIMDGAYTTMIERITSNTNPDFFFMSYNGKEQRVESLLVVPKHFFVPSIIEKRKPLSTNARRVGWTGCNILLGAVPIQGRISIIVHGVLSDRDCVVGQLAKAQSLADGDIKARGWLFDILNCVNAIQKSEFSLEQMYSFEGILAAKHPDNHNVRPKIRQQLQLLRNKGYIEFIGQGRYRRV